MEILLQHLEQAKKEAIDHMADCFDTDGSAPASYDEAYADGLAQQLVEHALRCRRAAAQYRTIKSFIATARGVAV